MLYQSLLQLEKDKKIIIHEGLKENLINEGTKNRTSRYQSSIPKNTFKAMKELKENKDITIKKADKSNCYVIMNSEDYKRKLNDIVLNNNKFKRVNKDPTTDLKIELNKIIDRVNSVQDNIHFKKLTGNYTPAYIYGNPKIHKNKLDPKLRPIISQVTSPIYEISKQINGIITKYMPQKFMINSTDEFINIIRTTSPTGRMASLDVESLFTNVPIIETIEIILENCYNNSILEKPKIPKQILKELLIKCTMQAPFKHIDGNTYYQTEGIAMGSPLGPTFANFYMCHIENQIINKKIKVDTYIRYVDDILITIDNDDQLMKIKDTFENDSVLKFSFENEKFNKISFLDVQLERKNNIIDLSVFIKETNNGDTINYLSECPERYKTGAISSLINRAYKISSNWNNFNQEILRLKQVFINNNFPNQLFDITVKKFIEKQLKDKNETPKKNKIKVYYENQMSKNAKLDEKILKNIIKQRTKCTNDNDMINLIIYYKGTKTKDHIIKNSLTSSSVLQMSHVVYRINCPVEDCELLKAYYIGQTQNSISRRMTEHLQNGAVKEHMMNKHRTILTRSDIVKNVSCIKRFNNVKKQIIYEALMIMKEKPSINKQNEDFSNVLKLY